MRRHSCFCCSGLPGPSCSTPVLPRTRSSSRCAGPSIRSWRNGWPVIRIRTITGCSSCTPMGIRTTLPPMASSSAAGTVVIGAERDVAWPYFGFADQPDSVAGVDLGGRVLDCLATPGHHQAAVTYYDRYSGILFTGNTVSPGRLYVFDWTAFVRSIGRLADWCAQRPVTYLIGCHIEMTTTPGVDYPAGWSYQPDEPPLPAHGGPPRAVSGRFLGIPRPQTGSLCPAAGHHHASRLSRPQGRTGHCRNS